MSCGPLPHGHCIHSIFAAFDIAAFLALLTTKHATKWGRTVGTTPAQILIMAARAL